LLVGLDVVDEEREASKLLLTPAENKYSKSMFQLNQ
jgi:hypothetical protein